MFSDLTTTPRKTLAAMGSAVLALAMASPQAHAASTAIYDNLASSQDGSDPIFSYGPLANSFTTGSDPAQFLAGIQALLKNEGPGVVGTLHVGLHADSGNAPGAELLSLGDVSSASIGSTAFAAYSFAPVASSFTLAQNTRYWVQIEAVSPNGIAWSWSGDTGALGVAGEFSRSATLGTAPNDSFGPYQMSISVAAVSEPDAGFMVMAGLGCVGTLSMRRRMPR